MKKLNIIVASNSLKSINREFATELANRVLEETHPGVSVSILNLNESMNNVPRFSRDQMKIVDANNLIESHFASIQTADLNLFFIPEFNKSYTSIFKEFIEYCTYLDQKGFDNLNSMLISVVPGKGGDGCIFDSSKLLTTVGFKIFHTSIISLYEKDHESHLSQLSRLIEDFLIIDHE